MRLSVLEHRPGYLAVDCSGLDGREMAAACRDLGVECIAGQASRILLRASTCDPEGHLALRDALTIMMLIGIPAGFRLALVTDAPPARPLFADLQRDLLALRVHARAFARESDAVDWLQAAAPALPLERSPAVAPGAGTARNRTDPSVDGWLNDG